MAETALTFGPDWIRAYSAGSASSSTPTPSMTIPKYKLAEHRYGREEMLALIPKDPKLPNCLKDFPSLVRDSFQSPMALIPMTEDEQRLWTRVNSDVALRQSGKTVPGIGRTGRGGSVDRGRGRGRGGYYQRGVMHDDPDDNMHGFQRPKTVERSLSANERDPRWDDRDRRYDRPYSNRAGIADDGFLKQESGIRGQHNYWRKLDKEDEGDWRSTEPRSADRLGGRGSWRNSTERDRRDVLDRNPSNRNSNTSSRSGPSPHKSHHSWKDSQGSRLPEWSVEETNESETVGTFDSSGAFLETKTSNNTSQDEIYISDDADEGSQKDSPEANKSNSKKIPKTPPNSNSGKSNSKKKINTSPQKDVIEAPISQTIPGSPKSPPNSKTKTSDNASKKSSPETSHSQHVQMVEIQKEFSSVTPHEHVGQSKTSKSSKIEECVLMSNVRNSENATPTSNAAEEDTFAYHKKATESMVAQWTEEDEQAVSQTSDVHSIQEKETKWFYRDPQGDVQGPFTSPEMYEWYSAGYFTINLQLRRTCDETFSELGDLIKSWGGVPFVLNKLPHPIRMPSLPTNIPPPIPQTSIPSPIPVPPVTSQLPKQEELLALQRQLYQQQLMQQQLILRQQAQMQALLAQLKQQDNFSSLSSQQQHQVLVQHVMAQQQMPRPNLNPLGEQSSLLDPISSLPLPLLGLSTQPAMNDMTMWNNSSSSTWPMNLGSTQPPGTSIWDVDITKPIEETEKQKRISDEQEKLRKAEELRLKQERELKEKQMQEELKRQQEKRMQEELKRQQEEARILQEIQKAEELRRQEEEQRRQEELRQLEEQRRQEELRQLEEQRRKEEEERKRQDELTIQEELKRIEELRKQEELKRQEELRKQEELKRQEDIRLQEERRQREELRKKEELQKQEEMRKQQEAAARKKEEEKKKLFEREKLLELEKQKEALRLKEIEREKLTEKKEREEQELAKKMAEMKLRSQGPVWGIKNTQPEAELSLADIQRLQEVKEREEKEERMRQQALQQHSLKQVQQNKNGLSWAKRATESQPAVKSLFEIQQEEAERLAQVQRVQKPQQPPPTLTSNAGVWSNTSHLNKITAPPQTWNTNNITSVAGLWDDVVSNNAYPQTKKQPQKSNETSAFPALSNRVQQLSTVTSNKSKNVRAKKEEDALARLFGSHHKPTDEFTKWCTDAISAMPSSVDVPTFVAFLKDIESPYEVYDYVKSYLGEGKEPREFAKQFLEKRSKYRNQAKQTPAEENTLWGPAPAITPTVNKPTVQSSNDCDGTSNAKSKAKKRKNKMQKLDNSMLGFTVQPNPERLNVGEIDHIEGV